MEIVKIEIDLSNYAAKAGLKEATGVYTADIANRADLANLKSDVSEFDIDKLKTIPVDLSKLRK